MSPARLGCCLVLLAVGFMLSSRLVQAAEPKAREERILFVPLGDLPVILNGPNERVFMTRDEYRALEAKARQEPPARAPEATVLLDAAYDVRIEDNLATLRGHIDLEVLEPGLHMVPLNFQSVTLRGASLDQRPAPIGRDASGQPVLFARTTGYHRLDLELQAPVAVTAARQSLQFQLPTAGSTTMNLAVPGNVEVKSGAAVARRTYDEAADETRFELLPDSEVMDLVMSLNNRRLRQEQVVVTRSVLVSELTSSYERLHITAEMRVVHGAVDRFLFDVPQGVQVTEVTSPLMAEWVVREEADGNILDVSLREPTRTTETLNISANRTPVKLGQWTMPRLKPRDVAGYVAVVGLIAEARLQPLNLTAENLIRLDTRVLREGLPASVFDAEPGAPAIRPIAAYYAPGDDFKCSAALEDPQDELRVATHLLLSLEAPKQALQGGFTLTPQASKLTTFAFKMPADWKLDQLHVGDHKPLPFDHYRTDGQARYVVKLPETIEPGKSRTMFFAATRHSSEWLTQWDSRKIRFPRVVVEDATESSGAIAVQTHGDLRATPVNTEKLVPLDAKERGRFGLADSSSELTYQVTGDQYQAEFLIQRKQPKISTRNYSFFQIKDGMLLAHHEVVFQIERAHANQLELTLPDSTPTSLSIHGLDGLQLKEYSHATREGRHHWTVRPAKPLKGMVHLGIDYVQRLDDPEPDELALPLVRAANVAYQTQMVSIEGDPALDVDLRTNMRPVDVGELVEADYAPGARLLGTFASTTGDETVRVGITRRELRPLPSAIVKRAELVTLLANSGISQSSARYLLRTKVPYLALELPRETELWSVTLDQKPIKPRRRGNQVLLGLQSEESTSERDLRVVYQTPIQTLNWLGRVRARAPRLRLLSDEQDQGTLVPQVDLVWHVVLPTGYTVSRERGTVFSSQLDHPKSPLQRLAKATAIAGGGAHGPPFMLARRARQARRTMAAAGDEGAASARSEPPGRDAPRALTPQMESNQAQQSQAAGTELGQLAGADNERRDEATATTDEPVETSSEPRLVDESNAMSLGEKPAAGPGEGREHQDGDRTGKPRDNASGSGPYGSASGYEQSEGGMGGGMGGMGGGMEGGPPPQGQPSPGQSAQPMGQRAPPRKPRSGETPATDPGQPDIKTGKYWALQGLRGLPITIDRPDQEIGWLMGEERTFRSLGSEPLLDITVFRNTRMQWLALSVALAVVVWGLLLMARPVASRIRFVVLVAIVSCGLPVLGGPTTEFVLVFEHALLAALALIPIWVILSAVTRSIRWLIGRSSRATIAATSAVLLAGLSVAGFGSTAEAQQEELKTGLETLLQREQPIRIPDDAVVIPYDPEDARWRSHATRVLVPYTRYVELWNQAHPGRKMGEETSQPTFSLAGAKYQATLEDEEHILLDGTVDIEVFSDQPVDVPLALNNAVITSAVLDGEPARLKTIVPRPGAGETQQQQARPKNAAPRAPAMLSLLVEGEGHHRLELTIRIAVDRQGGWRRARATIPHAEATAVELKVLEPGTTIRYPLKKTVLTETIDAAGQVLPLTLRENGLWDVTWRAQVSPGSSDQALTATSAALVDVREDGLRVVWQVELNFGQTERGVFRLDVPSDYLVEDVEGSNVRGWDSSRDGDRTLLNVELLKAVKQQETITLHLSRRASLISRTRPGANGSAGRESDPRENGPRGAPAQPEDSSRDRYGTTFTTPVVSVPDAALHRGTVQIRRSPILELRTLDATGVSRTEGEGVTRKLAPMVGDQESPLEARGYQAYQFSATPFTVRISASRIQPAVEARLRTIVRIGETESTLESEIRLSTQQRDIYVVEVAVPDTLRIKQVAAGGLTDWSLVKNGDRRLLRAFFSAGKAESVRLSLEGRLGGHLSDQETELPRLEVLDVNRQHGSIVVQADPSLDARTAELSGCQEVLLERATNWLSPEQRGLARLALEYRGNTYSGKILVSPRQPRVICNTITNVRVTYRDIQETVLIDFEITVAGVRQLRFRLPRWLRGADISAPRLRQKTITPLDDQDHVQVELTLQDAVTGQYRVVVENDRALAAQRQLAPLPIIDTGTVNNRYVTLENAGRDEIVVDGVSEMESVVRGSREWKQLTARLQAGNFASVYVATAPGAESTFGYRTKQRERVVTAGATIGLARTTLVLDPNGTYRASMLLKVDNRTEPYLEIRLPPNAELWTSHVAGDPVKPAQSVAANQDTLRRIPLIKTEEGDLDYEVVLKYAGQVGDLRFPRSLRFPIIRAENINIELSQVKLYLPETYRWYHFDGTAARVAGEEDFDAGFVAYQTQQLEELTQTIRSSNQFSRSRAIHNVEKLGKQLESWHREIEQKTSNEALQSKLKSNRRVLEAAEQQIRDVAGQEEPPVDNRGILNRFYERQENTLSKNSVTRLGSNFSAPEQSAQPRGPSVFQFNQDWFMDGQASEEAPPAKKPIEAKPGEKGKAPQGGTERLQQKESYRVRQQAKMPAEQDAAQQVFQKQAPPSQPADQPKAERSEHRTKADLGRAYEDKIQQQEQRQQEPRGRESGEGGAGGRAPSSDLYTEVDQSMGPRRGLSSLDFQLPKRGEVFRFTTPDHEVIITARPVKRELQERLLGFVGLLAMIGALLIAAAIVRRVSRSRTGRNVSLVLLCGCGLVLIVLALFPLFGLAMFLGSFLLAIEWHRGSKRANGEG